MTDDIWLIRYSEIFLKSEPVRRSWEDILIKSLQLRLPDCTVTRERGRIWISGPVDPDQLRWTFGIYSFSPCKKTSLHDLPEDAAKYAEEKGIGSVSSFALRVHRTGEHAFSSQDLARDIGGFIGERFPKVRVNLKKPEFELQIEVRDQNCYLYTEIIPGPGGVPQGASGTLVALHSGGIDSPVAMYMMMKRGCIIIPVYIKIAPFHDDRSEERAELIVQHLRRYQPDLTLRVIEDGHVYSTRMQLKHKGLEKYSCVFCKRHLYRLAEEITVACGAKGIVTGESLAQVASQTLDNLFVLDAAVSVPVYRPLIGFDKEETIEIARKIGTFDLSILQVPSCCCAIPFKPATTSVRTRIEEIELDLLSANNAHN
ncbi:MAG TPA: tRNA uracil 4-sulfurtransferase ThiI [Methanospirillum sp.]|nr:tRNA uracil 4-sulfurtransferase ThiI [Methanospirillum sp.]